MKTPKSADANVMEKQNPIFRVLNLLKDSKREVVLLLFLVLVYTGFEIASPLIAQKLIDKLISFFTQGGDAPIEFLFLTAGGILVVTVIANIVQSVYDYRLFTMVTRIEDKLRFKVFEKYLRLHVLFHHGSSSGQIIGRIDRGASAIYTIIHDVIGHNLFPPLIVFMGVILTLALMNIWVALAVFIPLPIYIISVKSISERIYEIEKRANEDFEAVYREAYDVASNVITVKKFYQEGAETQKQILLQTKARDTQYSAERLWKIIEIIQTVITAAGRISVILITGYFVINGQSTIGEFVLYVTLQGMAYNPLYQLSIVVPRLRRNTARAERLFGIMDEPILVTDKPDAVILHPHSDEIRFDNVWFRYNKKMMWALQGINVRIPAGKTVALVGRSGSGKTTFINLLLRSFDPAKGSIQVDGIDIRDSKRESLLNQMAVVPQEVDLFSRSIHENIAYGKPKVTRDAVIKAAKTALAHTFIIKTEKGYDTLVGERGIKLSGGERQRVGIARALLRDPKILVLDEATSHLDTESEKLIAKATNVLIKDRTTFIIAHRLSTILHADMILVFDEGKLEAVGRHAQLLRKSPTYKRLYSLQFGDI